MTHSPGTDTPALGLETAGKKLLIDPYFTGNPSASTPLTRSLPITYWSPMATAIIWATRWPSPSAAEPQW